MKRKLIVLCCLFRLQLVDGSDWQMVDTYQLVEYEHGLTMKFMELSDVSKISSYSATFLIYALTFLCRH